MTWSLLQSASLSNATTITPTVAVTNPIGSGNLYCGGVAHDSAQTLSSVTDDKSNTYNLSTTFTDTVNAIAVTAFWLGNITNGPKTITLHFSAATNSLAVVSEFSGDLAASNPSDGSTGQFQTAIAAGANNQTSTAITTTTAGDLAFGVGVDSNNTALCTAGTSPNAYTSINTATNTTNVTSMRTEFFSQVAAGSIAATFGPGANGDDGVTIIVAFKPAVTVAATGGTLPLLGVG